VGALALILREYLSDAFTDVQFELKHIIGTAAIAMGLMLAWAVAAFLLQFSLPFSAMDCFPITPRNIVLTPALTTIINPFEEPFP